MVELRLELKSTYDAKFAEQVGIIQGRVRAGTEEDTSDEKFSEQPLNVSERIQSEFVDKLPHPWQLCCYKSLMLV